MPTRRTRLAAAARWGCTVACVVLIVAWGVSGYVGVFLRSLDATGLRMGGVGCGVVVFEIVEMPGVPSSQAFREFGWQRMSSGILPAFQWQFVWRHNVTPGLNTRRGVVPFWPFVLALSISAGALWYRHRRRGHGPGRCGKCGYPLAGLMPSGEGASAVCPECGTPL
jgi:hypothetical protein